MIKYCTDESTIVFDPWRTYPKAKNVVYYGDTKMYDIVFIGYKEEQKEQNWQKFYIDSQQQKELTELEGYIKHI